MVWMWMRPRLDRDPLPEKVTDTEGACPKQRMSWGLIGGWGRDLSPLK